MLIDTSRPILAVDTGTSFLSLALRADGEVRLYHENVGTRQSELILPQIRVLFEQAGIGASDLGGIVYAQGPGAFTGLRIGAGVVQGLAPLWTGLLSACRVCTRRLIWLPTALAYWRRTMRVWAKCFMRGLIRNPIRVWAIIMSARLRKSFCRKGRPSERVWATPLLWLTSRLSTASRPCRLPPIFSSWH